MKSVPGNWSRHQQALADSVAHCGKLSLGSGETGGAHRGLLRKPLSGGRLGGTDSMAGLGLTAQRRRGARIRRHGHLAIPRSALRNVLRRGPRQLTHLERKRLEEALRYPGSSQLKHLATLLDRIQWWTRTPLQESIRIDGAAPALRDLRNPCCAGRPGESYAVYVPAGNAGRKIEISNTAGKSQVAGSQKRRGTGGRDYGSDPSTGRSRSGVPGWRQ